ncbi:MAG: roadblock/LC7 domain-containing protein [Nanoarchaeota archaeon]
MKGDHKKVEIKILYLVLIILISPLTFSDEIFFDDFESGNLNNWTLNTSGLATNWEASTENPYQGTYHALSKPREPLEPASIMEMAINTLNYQDIIFEYQRRLISIGSSDEFQVEWYNGSIWTIIEQTSSNSENDQNYVAKSFSLTSSANENTNFKIKFECTSDGQAERCRVDNVNITGATVTTTTTTTTSSTTSSTSSTTTTSTSSTTTTTTLPSNLAPLINSNGTIVNEIEKDPEHNEEFFIQVNLSDPEDDTIIYTNFTLINPDNTKVIDNIVGANYFIENFSIWNSTKYTINDYGFWNWSFEASDANNTIQQNGSFRVFSDLSFFPEEYLSTPDPYNETLIWNITMYHKSEEYYDFNFSSIMDTNFTIIFQEMNSTISTLEFNDSNLYKNQVIIQIDNNIIQNDIYFGNITITRTLDNKDFTIPLKIGINPPSGDIDAFFNSTLICSNGICDIDTTMENDESKIFTWMFNNTGNYSLTSCTPSITGFNITSFGSFSSSIFNLNISESTELSLTINQPSINTYYGQIEIICTATALGYNNSLSSDTDNVPNIKLLVVADSGSSSPNQGGGGGSGGGGGNTVIINEPSSEKITVFNPPPLITRETPQQPEGPKTEPEKEEILQVEEKNIFNKIKDIIPFSISLFPLLLLLIITIVGLYEKDKNKENKKLAKESAEMALEKDGFKIKKSTKASKLLETLQQLKKAGNIQGSAIISKEGLIIASDISKSKGAEKFSATSALMLKTAESTLERLNRGKLNHIIINAKDKKLIATHAGNKGILVSLTTTYGKPGLILLEIKKTAKKIEKILE